MDPPPQYSQQQYYPRLYPQLDLDPGQPVQPAQPQLQLQPYRPPGFYCKKYFIAIFAIIGGLLSLFVLAGLPLLAKDITLDRSFYYQILISVIYLLVISIIGTYGALCESLRCTQIYFITLVLRCIINGASLAATSFQNSPRLITLLTECCWTILVYRFAKDLKKVLAWKEQQQNLQQQEMRVVY